MIEKQKNKMFTNSINYFTFLLELEIAARKKLLSAPHDFFFYHVSDYLKVKQDYSSGRHIFTLVSKFGSVSFRSNSNDFCFTPGAFSFPPHPVTVLSTTTQLEINISDCYSMTTATYRSTVKHFR